MKRIIKTAVPIVMSVMLAAPLTAAAADASPHAASDEISIGVAQDFDSLDPDHMTAAGTKEIMFNVFEGLVKPSPEGEIVPAVASEVEKSDDSLTYTFTLRDDVTFHNGDPVEMEDVLYSIDRRRQPDDDAAAYLEALDVISDIKTADNTLTITLSEPSNEFLAYIMNCYILPSDYEDQETAPVGTGPYKFVSRSVQDSLVLERFDDYYGTKANIGKATFKVLENADGLVLGLQSGALDLVAHLSSDQTAQLDDDFTIETGSMNLVQALYLNNAEKPFDDVRVRQALCYAIDKQAVIDLAFDGYGIPLGTSMFPSFSKYYDESLTDYYTLDLAKAKELLTEAGYPDGFDMTITVPSNYTPHVNTATVLVELLREIGVNVTVQPVDWGTWLEDVYTNRKFQSTITGLTSDNMTARKLLERFGTDVGNNFTNYSNADYDETLAKALAAADDEEQTALYRELEKNLTENAANVYLQDMADLIAVRKGLTGLTFYPIYVLDVAALSWE